MKQTPDQYQNTYTNRVAQFQKEQKPLNAGPQTKKNGKASKTVSVAEENPYLRARTETLAKYPAWRRAQIEDMERNNDIDNHIYDDFVHDVAKLGDQYFS